MYATAARSQHRLGEQIFQVRALLPKAESTVSNAGFGKLRLGQDIRNPITIDFASQYVV